MKSVLDVFAVPVLDKYLIYSPLHSLVTLVDELAFQEVRSALVTGNSPESGAVNRIVEILKSPGVPAPASRSGPLEEPLFLGIIPTRGCNMACRYCGFAAPKETSPHMELTLAHDAVDAYLTLLHDAGNNHAEIHFFGGEPFFAPEVVDFILGYASLRGAELDIHVHFEATTNGLFSSERCAWIADAFDVIVLSLDGTQEIQDLHRPAANGKSTFETVTRNARILSEGTVELIFRSCVTSDSVKQLTNIARWMSHEFRPSKICFEPLVPSVLSRAAGLKPPDPWEFAENFATAARILRDEGVEIILSTADLSKTQVSCCPVGKDALIVSPEGVIDACYLLEEEWQQKGLDMRIGQLNGNHRSDGPVMEIDDEKLMRVRALNVYSKQLCKYCICRLHCAGGCHVNHNTSGQPGDYSDMCVQTRLVTIMLLLSRLGQDDLIDQWFADRAALEASALQKVDRIVH